MPVSKGVARRAWALDAPTLTVDKSILVTGTGGVNVTIPAPAFLIEHDEGLILFDTSLDPAAADDPGSVYGPLATTFQIDFPAERRLDRQIESIGFNVSDIRRIILSHSHFDHTGGLRLIPHAEGFVGARELRYAAQPDPALAGFYRKEDLDAARQIHWNELPVGYDHDLFGDGSITLLSLPGHTPGALGLKVALPSRTIIFAGDAAHLRENLVGTVGMPFDADSVSKLDSIRKLQLLQSQPDTTIWVSHDPEDWDARTPQKEVV